MPHLEPWRISTEAYTLKCVEQLFSEVRMQDLAWHRSYADRELMYRYEGFAAIPARIMSPHRLGPPCVEQEFSDIPIQHYGVFRGRMKK
jgi:hypothetical protein